MPIKPALFTLATVAAAFVLFVGSGLRHAAGIVWGGYEPDGHIAASTELAHVFSAWNKPFSISMPASVPLLVTLEPFGDDRVLQETAAGSYDRVISARCSEIASSSPRALIRWGHEMEISSNGYPWQGKAPSDYIAAYRHFVELCRKSAPQARFIWSPAGNKGSEAYWPGEEYVDMVGVSVYSYQGLDAAEGVADSFGALFGPKYSRLVGFGKPIVIAELGVTGSASQQRQWLLDMKSGLWRYPLLSDIVYFDSPDHPGVWGAGVATPDWTLKDRGLWAELAGD